MKVTLPEKCNLFLLELARFCKSRSLLSASKFYKIKRAVAG
jgi:hypothetical protein